LLEVKKLLGHPNLKMTERYAHLSPEYLKQTIQLLPIHGRTDTNTDTRAIEKSEAIGSVFWDLVGGADSNRRPKDYEFITD